MKTTSSYVFTWAGVRAGGFVLIHALLLIMFAQTGFGQFLIPPGYSPPTQGLVAWWQANGDATDSVGGHNGTLMGGASFVPGVYGQAFSFGSNERVYVPDSPAFRLSSLTIGAFVYVKANSWTILQRGDTRSGLDPYNLGQDDAGHFDMQITGTNAATDLQTPVVLNRWVHIAATFDANSGDLRIYLDGNLAAEETTSIRPLLDLDPTRTPGIGIGNTPSLYDFPLLGNIDEVVLYSRALSPSEVMSLVPEPSALGLAVLGLAMLARRRRP